MKEYYHIPPKGGWEPKSNYVVEVSVYHGNPIFKAILYTGFLNGPNNTPGGYSGIFINTGDSHSDLKDFMYIKAIRKIDMEIPNQGKQIKELSDVFELAHHKRVKNWHDT